MSASREASVPRTMHITLLEARDEASKHHFYQMQINGAFHSLVRYSVLEKLHRELVKRYGKEHFLKFPPKHTFKLGKLSSKQARERLQMLQDWLQHVAAQREVTHYEIFRNFLFNVRKEETKKWEMKTVDIEVCLVDGTVHTVRARNTASIDNVLEACMELVGVNRDLTYHFALYLIESDTMRIVRRLQEFETPGDSRTTPPGTRLMIRTAHLTREVVDSLLADPLALGLLYAEVASNVDRGWITPDDSAEDLARFRAEGDKLNYVSTASGLGSFCRQSFGSAVCSYPTEGSACTVMLDEVDLVLVDEAGVDFKFEVSRLRDCRTTGGGEIEEGDNSTAFTFEYGFGSNRDGAGPGDVRTVSLKGTQVVHLAMRLEQWNQETIRAERKIPIKKPQSSGPGLVARGINRVTTAIAEASLPKAGQAKPKSNEKLLFTLQLDNLEGHEKELKGAKLDPWDVGEFVELIGHDPTTMDVTVQLLVEEQDQWAPPPTRYKVVVTNDSDGCFESTDGQPPRLALEEAGRYIVSFGKLHESPMDPKDVSRAYTCGKVVEGLLGPQSMDVMGYLKRTSGDQHDITAWVASRDLLYPEERAVEPGETASRLLLAFTPDTLVVYIDCAPADLETMLPPAKPVPVAGDLGMSVGPGIRAVASALPLATIVSLADEADLEDAEFESKVRDSVTGEAERFEAPGRQRRDLLFAGTSLSGCVAHAAALMVNAELMPEAKGKGGANARPRARSVAFGAPPCFSYGVGLSPRAKELLLHMTTVVASEDEVFRLLVLYQMVGMAKEYFGVTLGEEIAQFHKLVCDVYKHDSRSAAKVKQEYESTAGRELVRKMRVSAANYAAKREHRPHLLFPAGGFKVLSRGDEVSEYIGLYAALPTEPEEHGRFEDVFGGLLSGSLDGAATAHHDLPWSDKLCSRLWDRFLVLEDQSCSDVGSQLEPVIGKVSVMEAPDGMTVSVNGANVEAIRCQARGRGLIGSDVVVRPGLILQNFVPDRSKTPIPAFGEFVVIESSPSKVVFTVLNMQSTTDALAVQINTIFGESNVFPITNNHITKSRAATGNEILAGNTDSRFLNNAFLRILLFVPRDKPEFRVVQRQAERIEWIKEEAFRKRMDTHDPFLDCMMPDPKMGPDYKVVARRSWLAEDDYAEMAAEILGSVPAPSTSPNNTGSKAKGKAAGAAEGTKTPEPAASRLPTSASEAETLELLQFLSDLEEMSCAKAGRLRAEVKRLSSTARDDFEETVKEIDAKVGRIVIRDILNKLDKEQIVYKQRKLGRLFKGAVGVVGCATGGLLAAVGAVVALPGFLVGLAGYAVQSNDFEDFVDGKADTIRDKSGLAVGAIGAAGMALPAAVGAGGLALIERSRSMFVPKVENLVSKNYTSSVRIILLALGGDPDTVRPEVALLEEAVINRFLDLAQTFRDDFRDAPGGVNRDILGCPPSNAMDWLLHLRPSKGSKRGGAGSVSIEECLTGWNRLEREWNQEHETLKPKDSLREFRENPAFSTAACKKLIYHRIYVIARFHDLRRFINNNLVLTFVGVHNAGKSEFIRRLWGFETNAHILDRTERINVFEVDGGDVCERQGGSLTVGRDRVRLSVIDTPGASDQRVWVANLWSVFADVSSYFVCVFKAGHIAAPEVAVVKQLEQLGRPFMVLINVHDRATEEDLIRCGKGSMETVRAQYAATLQVNEGRVVITDAMNDEQLEAVRKRIWHMLAPLISSGDPRSGQGARRQLALAMCHAEVIRELQLGLRDNDRRNNIANVAMSILSSPRGTVSADAILNQLEVWEGMMQEQLGTGTSPMGGGTALSDAIEASRRIVGIHLGLPLFHMGYKGCILEAVLDVAQIRVQVMRQPWLLNILSQLDAGEGAEPTRVKVPEIPKSEILEEMKTSLLAQRSELASVVEGLGAAVTYDPRDQSALRLIHDAADALGRVVSLVAERLGIDADAHAVAEVVAQCYIRNGGGVSADTLVEAVTTANADADAADSASIGRHETLGQGFSELVALVKELRSRPVDLTRILGISDSPSAKRGPGLHRGCPRDDEFGKEYRVVRPANIELNERALTSTLKLSIDSSANPTNSEFARAFLDHLGGPTLKIKDLLHFAASKAEVLYVEVEVVGDHGVATVKKFTLEQMLTLSSALLLAAPRVFGLRNTNEDTVDSAPRPALLFPAPNTCGLSKDELENRYLILGRLIGLVVGRSDVRLDLAFAPALYKILLGTNLGFADVEVMDKAAARGLLELAALPARDTSVESPGPAGPSPVPRSSSPGAASVDSLADRRVRFQYAQEATHVLEAMAHESLSKLCAGVENIVDKTTLTDMGLHALTFRVELCYDEFDELVSYLLGRGPLCTFQDDAQVEMWTRVVLSLHSMQRMAGLLSTWTGSAHLPVGGVRAVYPPLRLLQVRRQGALAGPFFHVLENTLVLEQYPSAEEMLAAVLAAIGVTEMDDLEGSMASEGGAGGGSAEAKVTGHEIDVSTA
eukprot:m.231614 g.231614  ORF g.231614 m.231614 type:complete len:2473 (-) comp15697_c0_seq1:13-7431(-)